MTNGADAVPPVPPARGAGGTRAPPPFYPRRLSSTSGSSLPHALSIDADGILTRTFAIAMTRR